MAQSFYRKGADIFNAANNQKIGATDWANNWTGRASEVAAPKYTMNPDYNPNDSNSNRYIELGGVFNIPLGGVANSSPATKILTPPAQKPAASGGVSVIDPFAGKSQNVEIINQPAPERKVEVMPAGDFREINPDTGEIIKNDGTKGNINQLTGKQFYRIGQTIYDAGTNKPITPDDWSKNWTGRATEIKKGYEAIPHPSKIGEYTNYIKQGNTLYGIKKAQGFADIPADAGGVKVDVQDENIRALLKYAGQADMTPDQVMQLLNLYTTASQEERDKIDQDLGIPDVVNSLFTKPSKTTQDVYNEAYNSSELPKLKERIAEMDKQIAEKRAQITAGVSELQNNPWLSQASRGGRLNNLKNTAEAELKNLIDQRTSIVDMYNDGVGEIEKVLTRYTSQLESDQKLNAEKLNYLLNQAEKQTTLLSQAKQNKNLRYLPDYLKAKADKNLDKTAFELTKQQLELQKLGLDVEKAKKDTGKLPSAVASRVDRIAGQFDGEKTVKNYAQLVEAANMIGQIPDNTRNPADNQALIYAFAKSMDPDSVVREGEYATVQKYSQTWLENFGFNAMRIFSNREFLTEEAVKNIKATIAKKFKGTESAYNNLANEYARRINKVTGLNDGIDYISNYAGGIMNESGGNIRQELMQQGLSQQEVEQLIKAKGESALRQWLDSKKKSSSVNSGMRTDRHKNPTALMWTPGVESFFKSMGYNVSKGDKFPESNNYTLNMSGVKDPVKATIDYIDKYSFYTGNGGQRWTHTAVPKDQWNKMSYAQKSAVVKQMYQKEGNKGALNQYFA